MNPPLKEASPSWVKAVELVWGAVGLIERRPILIGVDGLPGAGKSSFASWLAWQLGMKAVHLDLYIEPSGLPPSWRTEDLRRVLDARLSLGRPVVVEGVMLLDVLEKLAREPQSYIEKEEATDSALAEHVFRYLERCQVPQRAEIIVQWSSAEYDARVRELTNNR
jgi:hypothetical protein